MFKRNSLRKYYALILMFFTIVIGFSGWVIAGNINLNVAEAPVTTAVCYYTDKDGNKKEFTRIEKAVESANEYSTQNSMSINVFVYIKTNPIIYKNFTISENVTLGFPYDNNGTFENSSFGTNGSFADNNASTYRMNRVIISENVVITNYGSIKIGGQYGKTNQGMSGGPNGNYCELAMMKNSKIISYGSITNNGFIKEADFANNGSLIEIFEGTLNIPFIIYDLKSVPDMLNLYGYSISSGMDTSEMIKAILKGRDSSKAQCPFDMYDFCSIQTKLTVYYGVIVNGKIKMEIDDTEHIIDLVIIGPNTDNTALILNSGYITIKYNPQLDSNGNLTNITPLKDINCYTQVDLFGELTIGSLQFSFSYKSMVSVDIDTREMCFPISYKFRFNIKKNAKFNVNYNVKFLPGSNLYIEKGGRCDITSNLYVFPSSFNEANLYQGNGYPSGMGASNFINNGMLVITGQLGGYINNNDDGATTYVKSEPTSISVPESTSINLSLSMDTNDGADVEVFGYESSNKKWIKNSKMLISASISSTNGTSSEANTEFETELKLTLTPSNAYKKIDWKVSPSGIDLSNLNDSTPLNGLVKLPAAANSSTTYTFTATIIDEFGMTIPASIQLKSVYDDGGCFASDTLVTMGDGSQKEVKDIVPGEEILSFNHFTGEYESTKIAMLVNHGYDYYNVMNLEFSNGSKIKFMAQHGLFDVESKEYKVMTVDNYKSFIGKTYLQYDSISDSNKEVILDNVYITNEYIEAYSILSSRNINAVAENILTMSTSTPGIFNIFELDDNYMVDKELMKQDIEKYGLVTYEEYKDYVPYELFYDLNFEYLNISIAKGLITEEEIARQIEWYHQMIENGEIII